MKKIAAIVLSVGVLLGTAGCSTSERVSGESAVTVTEERAYPPETIIITQKLPDDREVMCVWAAELKKGGLSCDWANAK